MVLDVSDVWLSDRCSVLEGYEVVAINDLTSPKMLAHLLKYDSAQGGYADTSVSMQTVSAGEDSASQLTARTSRSMREADAKDLPWGELGVDVVLECTGFYTSKEKASGSYRSRR